MFLYKNVGPMCLCVQQQLTYPEDYKLNFWGVRHNYCNHKCPVN